MKTLFASAFLAGLVVLGCQQDDGMFATPGTRVSVAPVKVVSAIGVGEWPDDPVTVDDAVIDGDTLLVTVGYAGGCRVHSFRLVVSSGFVETTPPSAGALLAHEAYGDTCTAPIQEQLRLDLTPVKQAYAERYGQRDGAVMLSLGERELRYDF